MRKFIRGCFWGLGSYLLAGGLLVFLHDCLMLAGLAKPAGDGPFGLIAGPIFVVIGVVLVAFLWNTRSLAD